MRSTSVILTWLQFKDNRLSSDLLHIADAIAHPPFGPISFASNMSVSNAKWPSCIASAIITAPRVFNRQSPKLISCNLNVFNKRKVRLAR